MGLPSKSFQDLLVWQKAHNMVLTAYEMTKEFPDHERFGLTSQLRRAAVSVPANIAEGFRKRGKADKIRYLNIAEGSLEEARYYVLLARDLGYAQHAKAKSLLEEVSKMLDAYSRAIYRSAS